MPLRRLNDRIYVLCEMLAQATDGTEAKTIAQELRTALHEQSKRLRKRLTAPFIERRSIRNYTPSSTVDFEAGFALRSCWLLRSGERSPGKRGNT